MIRVKVDNETYLEVDFEGLLTKCEEECLAYRLTGKNNQAIATILGKSTITVNKQQVKAYEKLEVNGTDNPLVVLQLLSFRKGWVRFAATAIVLASILMPLRARVSTRTLNMQARSGRETQLIHA